MTPPFWAMQRTIMSHRFLTLTVRRGATMRTAAHGTSSLHCSSFPDYSMISSNHRQTSTTATSLTPPNSDQMKDEYDTMDDSGHSYVVKDYKLEHGAVLPHAELRYQTYGTLNSSKTNVLLICHALTGNASLHSWWGELLGDGRAFDTSKCFVVCCNILGSCYGSTSPKSINPDTGKEYGIDFPDVSVKDTVRLQLKLLQDHLGVTSVKSVIGGSFGGMQSVEAAVLGGSTDAEFVSVQNGIQTPFVKSVIPIACGAFHTAWQIAISEVQRQSIYADHMWQIGRHGHATMGLAVARQMGMVTYRTAKGYQSKFGRSVSTEEGDNVVTQYGSAARWKTKSYLEYQGQKFLSRFDPVTYVKMTEQMDSHDISRGRHGTVEQVLARITIPALVMGIDSDVLYPLSEQAFMAEHIAKSTFKVIQSDDGHDGFLLEQDQVAAHITDFLKKIE